jgi:hypothetical protein
MSNSKETIAEGLGILEVWADEMHDSITTMFENNDRVSDLILSVGKFVQEESFGEVTAPLSEYEKKLIYAGYIIANKLSKTKLQSAAIEMAMKGGLSSILKKLKSDLDGKDTGND